MSGPCDRCSEPATTFYGGNYGHRQFCRAHQDEFWAEERARFKAEIEKVGGPIPQTCPQRSDHGPWDPDAKGEDLWTYGHGIITQDNILTCNFCGSCHPAFFMDALRSGWQLGTTSKSYKAYLSKPTGEQVAKFYFQHLPPSMRVDFVDLVNSKAILFSGGFGFEALPFFMRPA